MTEKINEKMPTRGIRMPDELWKTCIEMSKELGYGYPSDFIRDALNSSSNGTTENPPKSS